MTTTTVTMAPSTPISGSTPMNAKAMATEITTTLVAADPANALTYEANARRRWMTSSMHWTRKSPRRSRRVKNKPFIVFHDAYQYFEHRYHIRVAGSITVSPETIPGAERVSEIHKKVGDLGATCVFAEPQFEPRLVDVVIEGTRREIRRAGPGSRHPARKAPISTSPSCAASPTA